MQAYHVLILVLGILQATSVVYYLAKSRGQPVGAAGMLLCLILLLLLPTCHFLLSNQIQYAANKGFLIPPLDVSLGIGPCVYLFVIYLTRRTWSLKDNLHFMPLTLQICSYVVVTTGVVDVSFPWQARLTYMENALIILSMSCYLLLSWRSLTSYHLWLENHRSDARNYDLSAVGHFLLFYGVCFLLWGLTTLSQWWPLAHHQLDFYWQTTGLISVNFLILALWRLPDTPCPVKPSDELQPPLPTQQSVKQIMVKGCIVDTSNDDAIAKLTKLCPIWHQKIIDHNWWREPRLTLQQLAEKLATSCSSLSIALQVGTQQSFSDVINRLRIEFICQQMDAANLDIKDIAYEAGYRSERDFRINFKRFTTQSPEQYARKIKP